MSVSVESIGRGGTRRRAAVSFAVTFEKARGQLQSNVRSSATSRLLRASTCISEASDLSKELHMANSGRRTSAMSLEGPHVP